MKFSKLVLAIGGLVTVSLVALIVSARNPVVAAAGCTGGVEVMYLRGSGQKSEALSGEEGYPKERDSLRRELGRIFGDDNFIFTEIKQGVGSAEGKYPAAAVIGTLDDIQTGAGAVISQGRLGDYKKSLEAGVDLIGEYINARRLSEGCIVIVGYSQGAHVIGDALEKGVLNNVKDKIVYIGLLGDPKLDTQGYGSFLEYGKYTPWYRGNAVPWLQSGLLGPRRPDYIPRISSDKMEAFTKVGSWCYDDDPVCTSNFAGGLIDDGHGKYAERAVPAMAQEIANAVAERTGRVSAGVSCKPLRQDIVLAINFSPTMRSDRVFMSPEGIDKTVDDAFDAGCDVRVGLVEFGRPGKEPTRPVVDFTSDPQQLKAAIAAYANTGTPVTAIEAADVLGGAGVAMDYTWRDSAQKAIYVISDAAGDWYGTTNYWNAEYRYAQLPQIASLVERSRDLGGVEVYAIKMDHDHTFGYQDPDAANFYGQVRALVDRTAGHFGELGVCNFCTWMHRQSNFQTRHADKPATIVAPVRVKVGETVELTAQDVYGTVDSYNQNQTWSYRWYTNCDDPLAGRLDPATVTFRPSKPGTCTGAVEVKQMLGYCPRCYDGAGSRQAIATFPIEILPADYLPPPLPAVPRNITKEYLWGDEILRVSWEPPENAAQVGELAYVIKDADGNIVGVTTATTLHITDVAPDDIPIVTVSVASANGVGESVSTDTADDLTGPAPELPAHDDGAVLSASDVQQLQQMPVGVPTITANTSVSGGLLESMARPSLTYAATNATATALAELHGEVAHVAARSSWLNLTIIAVPLALLASLGVAVKYGVLLKLK